MTIPAPAIPDVAAPMRLPDFIILGEMKCGTTTLWDLLSRSPRVFLPDDKELHFFGSYAKFPQHGRYEHDGLARYAALFESAPGDAYCGEATPNYLSDAGACRRIREALPEVRLLAVLRDPVDRAWSHYWHQIRRGTETLGFTDALEAEADRLSSGTDDDRMMFGYVHRGRYAEHLNMYADAFGAEALHVVLLPDLKRDPAGTMRGVFEHLGLSADAIPADLAPAGKNRADYPKWPAVDRATRAARRVADAGGPWARSTAAAVGRWTRPWRTYRGAGRMPAASRARLERVFAEPNRQLAEWLGRPLPWGDA